MDSRPAVPEEKETVARLGETARAETAKLAGQARERATSYVAGQKGRAADSIGKLAGALLQAAHALDEDGERGIGRYAMSAAQRMDGVARYVREADLGRVAGDTERVARRHPVAFIGGTFLAGLAVARFLKSSRRAAEPLASAPAYVETPSYAEPPYGDVPYTAQPLPVTRPVGG